MHIGHYAPDIWAPGGVTSYMRRVGRAQAARGETVSYVGLTDPGLDVPDDLTPTRVRDENALYRWAASARLDVLHVHKPLQTPPPRSLPLLRTLHDHAANCPSGSRYLARSQRPCNRVSGVGACTWGYLVDDCGSLRPSTARRNVARFRREHHTLKAVTMHAVSNHVRDRMVADGYEASRIHVLHSPAPPGPSSYDPPPRSGPVRFLFLGRLVPEKGLAPLLRALSRLPDHIRLDVAGEGHQRAAMQTLSDRLGLADRVTFHGWLGPDLLGGLMRQARAVVFPSLWNEPAGLISLEAAAAGRAVIASHVGGIPEYASDAFALLTPPGAPSALADAMSTLASDYERAAELGHAGRRIVAERLSMDRFLSGLRALYRVVRERALSPALT
jgi:glycosyltransferase involved in cell wall biosynthesis